MNFKNFLLLFFLTIVCVLPAAAQVSSESLFDQAKELAKKSKYEESNTIYKDIVLTYLRDKNWPQYYQVRYEITNNLVDLYRFEEAKKEIEGAIQHFESNYKDTFLLVQPRLYHAAGQVHLDLHQYEKAIAYNRTAMKHYQKVTDEKERKKFTSYMYNNIGQAYKTKRSMDSAKYYFELALPLKIEVLGHNAASTLRTLKAISGIYQDWGQLDKAIEIQTISLNGAIADGNKNMEAQAYNGLSQMYQRKSDYETSKLYISKAMEIYRIIDPPSPLNLAHSYHQMGNVLETEKAHKESLEWYMIAKGMYREIHNGKYSYQEGNSTMNLGKAHNYMAQQLEATSLDIDATNPDVRALRAKAIKYFEENEAIFEASVSKEHARWIELWLSKGVCHLENLDTLQAHQLFQKAYDRAYIAAPEKSYDRSLACLNLATTTKDINEALELYQQGLWDLSNGWEYTSIDDNPSAKQVFYEDWSVQIMYNKAERIRQLSAIQNDPSLLNTGIRSINAADKLLAESRASFLTTSAKISLGRKGHDIYSKGIELCYEVGNKEEQAFQYIEKDKGLVLLEALQTGKRIHDVMVPDSINSKLTRISAKIAELTTTQNQYRNSDKYSEIGAQIFDWEQERKEIQQYIRQEYPITAKISDQGQIKKLADIQSRLSENEVIYEYSESDYYLYTLKIERDNSKLYKTEIRSFNNDLDSLLQLISDEDLAINKSNSIEVWQKFQDISHKLFKKLLPDYNKEDLLIIPTGKLNYLPFELLLTAPAKGEKVNYSELPYLLKAATIKYGFSTSLHYASVDSKEDVKRPLLALAPSYPINPQGVLASRAGFTTLAHTVREATSVSNLMNGDFIGGQEATVEKFKENVNNYKVLHLAMHAFTHEKDPMLSGMVFSESEKDNILHAHELYNMNIPSELVVLSACNTGLGQYREGEGVMSLGRAFRHAGTKNIVMSLWQANDASTSDIMTEFYKNLEKGANKANALREAKLHYLESGGNSFPHYWSSFILLGDDKPLELGISQGKWKYALLGFVILLGCVVFINRKKLQPTSVK